jgi:hypothetical protein
MNPFSDIPKADLISLLLQDFPIPVFQRVEKERKKQVIRGIS